MNHQQTKYVLAVVEPDAQARNRFRESTQPVHHFGEVMQCAQISDLLSRLEGGARVDIIFLSSKFDAETLRTFIKRATATKFGEVSCYVQLVDANRTGSSVATQMLGGIDGFLMEPYSVESLVNIAELATRVKREKSDARERAALNFIINDIVTQIDRVAFIISCKRDPAHSLKKLKEMCAALRALEGSSFQTYVTMIIERFEHAQVPHELLARRSQYAGGSSRVRKLLDDKLIADLEAEAPDPKKLPQR